jgi:hypothetical protein
VTSGPTLEIEARMNWEAIGASGEILGSLAVIGSIFYLALQVRHAAAVAKANTQQSAAQMSIDTLVATLDPKVLSIASRKATKGEELGPDELSNYLRWVWTRMRVAENSYYQYRQGLLDLDAWLGHSATILAHVGPGSVAEPYWGRVSLSYSDRFIDEVDRILDWGKEIGVDGIGDEQRAEYLAMLKKSLDMKGRVR